LKLTDTNATEVRLFAEERARSAAELRAAMRQLPATARRALHPIRWFRRYPLATGAAMALSLLALAGGARSARRRSLGSGRSWLQTLSLILLGTLRRALTAAVTARLAWRGATGAASDPSRPYSSVDLPHPSV
jgi:hypothetical protein